MIDIILFIKYKRTYAVRRDVHKLSMVTSVKRLSDSEGNRRFQPFCSGHGLDESRTTVWGRFSVLLNRCAQVGFSLKFTSCQGYRKCACSAHFYQGRIRRDLDWPWDSRISHHAFHLTRCAPDVQTFEPMYCPVISHVAYMSTSR